jgi:hypothetical protein
MIVWNEFCLNSASLKFKLKVIKIRWTPTFRRNILPPAFEVLTAVVMKSSIFWDITPCSLSKVNRRSGGTNRPHLPGRRIIWGRNQCESRWQAEPEPEPELCMPSASMLVSCLAYFTTLRVEAICSSETSVEFLMTTLRYIPEDSTLYATSRFRVIP